jgi:ubiquinone/menaquinone biosynthesis C-methylase UbiE
MKTRESGMPEEDMWRSFFDPEAILSALGLDHAARDAVDFGCGYGTFSLPAARRIRGTLHGFDIELEMVAECERRAEAEGVHNARFYQRDFVTVGTGLSEESVDYAMLFNILHAEEPRLLLREAWRILGAGGTLAVIHWNYDPATPRGPSMDIRPRPEQCRAWAEEVGFVSETDKKIDLPPHHYGWLLRKHTGAQQA